MAWGGCTKKQVITFDTKNKGKIAPVVKLRHAKVAVVDGIHGKNQWHTFAPVSHRLVFIFPDKTIWRSIGGVACFVVAVVPVSVAVVVCRSTGSGRVGT